MLTPHFLPASVAWILQWAKDQNWDIRWIITMLQHTIKFERGSYAASFTLPASADPSEWEAILTTWQKQNDPAHKHDTAI